MLRPIEFVAEVLSPQDEPVRTLPSAAIIIESALDRYTHFDPMKRTAWVWHATAADLVNTAFGKGMVMPVASVSDCGHIALIENNRARNERAL